MAVKLNPSMFSVWGARILVGIILLCLIPVMLLGALFGLITIGLRLGWALGYGEFYRWINRV